MQTEDFFKMSKLYETNPHFSINGDAPCQPKGIPTEWSTLLLHFAAL